MHQLKYHPRTDPYYQTVMCLTWKCSIDIYATYISLNNTKSFYGAQIFTQSPLRITTLMHPLNML